MTFCLILYMLLPNGLDIRPTVEAVGRSNIAMSIDAADLEGGRLGQTCAPSIHCQSSACMALAFSHSKLAKERPGPENAGLGVGCTDLCVHRVHQAALHH